MFKLKKSNLSRNLTLRNGSPGYAHVLYATSVCWRFGLPCTHLMSNIPLSIYPSLHSRSFSQDVCMEVQTRNMGVASTTQCIR